MNFVFSELPTYLVVVAVVMLMESQLKMQRGFINGSQRLEYKCTFLDALVHESLVLLIDCLFFWFGCRGMRKASGWIIFGLGCLASEIDSTSTLTRFVGVSTLIGCMYELWFVLMLFLLPIRYELKVAKVVDQLLAEQGNKNLWPHQWFLHTTVCMYVCLCSLKVLHVTLVIGGISFRMHIKRKRCRGWPCAL